MWSVYALGMTRGVQKCLSNFFQKFFQHFLPSFEKSFLIFFQTFSIISYRVSMHSGWLQDSRNFCQFFSKYFFKTFCQIFREIFYQIFSNIFISYYVRYRIYALGMTWGVQKFCQIFSRNQFFKIFCQIFFKHFLLYHVGCLCTRDDSRSPKTCQIFLQNFFSKIFWQFFFKKCVSKHFIYSIQRRVILVSGWRFFLTFFGVVEWRNFCVKRWCVIGKYSIIDYSMKSMYISKSRWIDTSWTHCETVCNC